PAREGRRALVSPESISRDPPFWPASQRRDSLSCCCSNSSSAVMLAFLMRPGSCWLGSPDCRRNRRARPGRGGPAGREARSADVRKDAGRLVVLVLFLVLEDLAVELVRQQVDGRVHGLG